MSGLNTPVTREELQNLLIESHKGLRRELDLAVPEKPRGSLQGLREAAIRQSTALYYEVVEILAGAPERIETEADLTQICAAVKETVERVTCVLSRYKPETNLRNTLRKKEVRTFDAVPRLFHDALRRAQSALKDRDATVDLGSVSSATQSPESGLEARD